MTILRRRNHAGRASIRSIEAILKNCDTVAIVGLSPKESRPSHNVAIYLQANGYRIVPVNPRLTEVLGIPCYPNLKAIPHPVELVDIFRRPEEVFSVVEEAIQIGAEAVWMQLGIVNEAAASLAEKAGLDVVMDKCTAIEHKALFRAGNPT